MTKNNNNNKRIGFKILSSIYNLDDIKDVWIYDKNKIKVSFNDNKHDDTFEFTSFDDVNDVIERYKSTFDIIY